MGGEGRGKRGRERGGKDESGRKGGGRGKESKGRKEGKKREGDLVDSPSLGEEASIETSEADNEDEGHSQDTCHGKQNQREHAGKGERDDKSTSSFEGGGSSSRSAS